MVLHSLGFLRKFLLKLKTWAQRTSFRSYLITNQKVKDYPEKLIFPDVCVCSHFKVGIRPRTWRHSWFIKLETQVSLSIGMIYLHPKR